MTGQSAWPESAALGAATPADPAVAPALAMFAELIPGLERRADAYRVSTADVDGEIRALFAQELARLLPELRTACAAREASVIRIHGHSLEGMGGAVGYPEISVVGAELRRAAREAEWELCAGLTARLGTWRSLLAGPEQDA